MQTSRPPVRIVQWTTGLVARQAVKAIADRDDLEIVGAYAFSKDKVGRDVGDLCDLGRQLGVTATDDIDALIRLEPDCVLYMPLHPDIDDLTRLLRAGVNVVTTAFVTAAGLGADVQARLDEAARAGGATLFGTGIHPGITDFLAAAASGLCRDVTYVRVLEAADLSLWAADPNQDEFGWGRPAGDPGHAKDVERATAVDIDSLDLIARQFGVTLDDTRCEVEFAHATSDLDIPGRPVKKGTVAGIDIRWIGVVGGKDTFEINLQWTLGTQLEPVWDKPDGFFVLEVKGQPAVTLRLEVMPEDIENLTLEDMTGFGQIITAMPAVNAIRAVVDASPGFLTYAEIPATTAAIRKDRP